MYRSILMLWWWCMRCIRQHWCIPNSGYHRVCYMTDREFDVRECILCLAHRLSFSTRVSVQYLSTATQQRILTRTLSPITMWKIFAYLMWMGFELTTSRLTICLTTSTPSLLTILNALNFRNLISLDSQSLWRSFPVINISKSRMFIQNS